MTTETTTTDAQVAETRIVRALLSAVSGWWQSGEGAGTMGGVKWDTLIEACEQAWPRETLAAAVVEGTEIEKARLAIKSAIPWLVLLGDYIGNGTNANPHGRCDALAALHEVLGDDDVANAYPGVVKAAVTSSTTVDKANTEVTDAIFKAERALTNAILSWQRVEKAEVALAQLADLPAPEKAVAERGVGRAQIMVDVLRALLREGT